MLSVRQFRPLMQQSVTIKPFVSYDDTGTPTYGTGVNYQCAVVWQQQLIRGANGQEMPSRGSIYLMSDAAIRSEDQVTLSTGDAGSTEDYAINPPIIGVERYPFTRGQFHTVVRV